MGKAGVPHRTWGHWDGSAGSGVRASALLPAAPARPEELLAQSRPRVTETRTASDAGPVGRVPDFQKVAASLGRQGPAKSGAREMCC